MRKETAYDYMIGQTYSRLTILAISHKEKSRVFLKAKCICGSLSYPRADGVKNGKILSCGCLRRQPTEAVIGKTFGQLKVISFSHVYRGNSFVNVKCSCGKEKAMRYSSLLEGKIISCGCYKTDIRIGSNSPSWKGGVTPEHEKIRHSLPYRNWRKAVLEKEKCCRKCNCKTSLQVHHLEDFSSNPDKRFSVENGAVLCKACHTLFHKIYGKHKKNTTKQFYKFLTND